MKSILSAALVLATALSAGAAANPAPASTPPPAVNLGTNASPEDTMTALFGDDVIAKGKGFDIKRSELDRIVTGVKSQAAASGQLISPSQLKLIQGDVLQQLIMIQLLWQQANDADKAVGKKKADEQFAALVQRLGSEESFNMQLKAAGISRNELFDTAVRKATATAVLQRQLGVAISDKEISGFYTSNSTAFEVPETVHLRHILFSTMDLTTGAPLSDDAAKAKRKQADDVLKQIRSGGDFAKLAAQYSDDTMSKNNGGTLPQASRNQLTQSFGLSFTEAAFALNTNQVSDVVAGNFGYDIIQLLDKSPARKLALNDKLPSGDMTISDYIKDHLTQVKLEKLAPPYIEKMEDQSDVQIMDPDLKSAVSAARAMARTNAPAMTP